MFIPPSIFARDAKDLDFVTVFVRPSQVLVELTSPGIPASRE
jgi:hypothetical protein